MTVADMVRVTNANVLLGSDHQDQEIKSAFCSETALTGNPGRSG